MLNLPVERPDFIETTALGAAMLAGVGAGVFASLEEAALMRKGVRAFQPAIDPATRSERLEGWTRALARI
jgi:glycerol kinase